MNATLTARLRQEVRLQLELEKRSLEELAVAADLSSTTLQRFIDDGELSTSACMRLASAMGWVRRLRVKGRSASPTEAQAPLASS